MPSSAHLPRRQPTRRLPRATRPTRRSWLLQPRRARGTSRHTPSPRRRPAITRSWRRGSPVQLASVTPSSSAAGGVATLALFGGGFDEATTVALVPAVGPSATYAATSVSLDTFSQLTATFDLGEVPEGLYSVIVTRADGTTAELTAAFTVTSPAPGHLVTNLILPSAMGRHISSTIYVQYSNTGGQALPAPLLVLYAPPETVDGQTITNLPLFTLNPALQVSGYWTSALPAGYSHTVQILATGTEVPGWLEPGESITVPGLLRRHGAALELQRDEL